jgi:hypothetical protein
MVMAIFAAESALLRAEKLASRGRGEAARQMTAVLVQDAIAEIERQATTALAACGDGSALDQQLGAVRKALRHTPLSTIALRREIAGRLRTAEKYVV